VAESFSWRARSNSALRFSAAVPSFRWRGARPGADRSWLPCLSGGDLLVLAEIAELGEKHGRPSWQVDPSPVAGSPEVRRREFLDRTDATNEKPAR